MDHLEDTTRAEPTGPTRSALDLAVVVGLVEVALRLENEALGAEGPALESTDGGEISSVRRDSKHATLQGDHALEGNVEVGVPR
jgi:hypothetical protein